LLTLRNNYIAIDYGKLPDGKHSGSTSADGTSSDRRVERAGAARQRERARRKALESGEIEL
jgi:hypothetical protein